MTEISFFAFEDFIPAGSAILSTYPTKAIHLETIIG